MGCLYYRHGNIEAYYNVFDDPRGINLHRTIMYTPRGGQGLGMTYIQRGKRSR